MKNEMEKSDDVGTNGGMAGWRGKFIHFNDSTKNEYLCCICYQRAMSVINCDSFCHAPSALTFSAHVPTTTLPQGSASMLSRIRQN